MHNPILEGVDLLWSLCRKFGGDYWNVRMIRHHKVRYPRFNVENIEVGHLSSWNSRKGCTDTARTHTGQKDTGSGVSTTLRV